MRHCDGRLFDGSACNNDLLDCAGCGASGCVGDGCDNQTFVTTACCGQQLGTSVRTLASAAA
ncbi:MAG: hypothetical protein QOD07_1721 [Frankiaceae bacterium]|jgi:hypothetical protein|nr:hypothetical protein [Frankiaceae bacterium]